MSYFYYEVFDSDSNRICMCGSEADASLMVQLGQDRTYVKKQFLAPDTVNTTAEEIKQNVLPQRLDLPEGKQEPIALTK